jgi:hypothetical protein
MMRARRYLRVIGIFVVSFLITFNALSYHASEEDLHDREEVARESPCLPCAVFEARSSLAPARAVDVVYTWVNGSDPAFRDALARRKAEWELVDAEKRGDGHGNGESGAKSSDENELGAKRRDVAANLTASNLTKNRFDDHDELRYSLRSVWMHAPWIRNVIVVTNGQIPSWLNLTHPKVRVVTHAEIFPNAEHLPTFSSHAIEMHLHSIPGISKTFLYMNDDFFLGADVGYDDFYTEAKGTKVYLSWIAPPCDYACKNEIRAGKWAEPRPASSFEMDVFGQTLAYANYLLDDAFGEAPVERKVAAHAPHLVDVEIMREVENQWREEHEQTSSHYFRHPMDLQYQTVYLYYLMNAKRGRTSFEFVSAFDVDGDGKLSKRELRHLVAVLTQKASDDVAAAKAKHEDEVQRLEDAYKSIVKAAEDKAWASENELDKAEEAAEMTVEEAKEAANEELKAGLAAAEEALAAAEEVAAIEIKGWRDAADAIFSSSLNMSFLDSDQDGLDRDDPLPVHVESLLKDKTVAAKIDKIVAKEKKYEYEIADSNGAPELRHAPSLTHSRSFSSRIGRALIPLL